MVKGIFMLYPWICMEVILGSYHLVTLLNDAKQQVENRLKQVYISLKNWLYVIMSRSLR